MNNLQVNSRWHIERGIPIALLFALVLQTVTIAWWASNVSTRLDVLERRVDAALLRTAPMSERIARLESKMDHIAAAIDDLRGTPKPRQPRSAD